MIVVSLLLILVAVTLLVLGLTGGSSTLLISSIVASLLAAVFLVIGARHAAARRRTAAVAPDGVQADRAHDPALGDPALRDPVLDDPAAAAAGDDRSVSVPVCADRDFTRPGPRPADDDTDPGLARPASARAETDSDFSGSDTILADPAPPGDGRQAPDYDRASSVIGAARSRHDDSWRRDPGAEPPAGPAGASAAPGPDARAEADVDEFDEPDADDPADEPLPQAVRPGDAVQMARIDAEVLVVDGRPRYHLADCPHLVGRLTEPLPAREAVELGFSPCGLCRPVDRLVARATQH